MDDLISRQAAIDELVKMLSDCFYADEEVLDAVKTTLKELPPAQPEQHIDADVTLWITVIDIERVKRVIVDEDKSKFCRQFYMDAQPEQHYDEWCDSCKEYDKEKHSCPRWNKVIKSTVEELKSAQPEIIFCKDCKHSEHWYRDKRRCFLWHKDGIDVFEDGFCNYAERREE